MSLKDKRTTIVLENDDKKLLENLIAQGKEKGIKPFISKMFDLYRSMGIYDWKFPGEYYNGASRLAFINAEVLDSILLSVPTESLKKVGATAGQRMRISIAATSASGELNVSWILKDLRVKGYGDMILNANILTVRNPFISKVDFMWGFLETLLQCKLEVLSDSRTSMIFSLR